MSKSPTKIALGPLELAVLDRLWEDGPGGVAAVHLRVHAERSVSRNTIHSTLERLVRKGLVERRKVGRAYEYRARVSRREWITEVLGSLIERVPGVDAPLLASAFVDLAERTDEETLAELEALVRARRAGEKR
ncbi:MAG: BlaI/MecI/CopY family transcriptional regulator [Proteobacteria bacterium]|nr:BlaI/MecI/CopY family transcriptional regulator [Pseudomonadota bacterium]